MSARDLESEVRQLRARITALVDEAAANERLLKKSQQRELELLKADSLPQLFKLICEGLAVSYGLEAVSLVLIDPNHEIRHLLLAEQIRLEDFPNLMFVDSLVGLAPSFRVFQKPWLGRYVAGDHQLLFGKKTHVGSIALIPLLRQSKLHGSLNFGSADPERFARHLGTDFLAHLGVIAAFAIENAINRARLVRSGLTDFLTGWHNRRYLHVRLKEELARAQRNKTGVACLLIDLDHFKQINDRHGHLAGDAALREAAQRIDCQIRGGDAAARFGGDEFVVLAPALSAEQAHALAERIRHAVSAKPVEFAPEAQHTLTVSIGIAVMQMGQQRLDFKEAAERLLTEADSALYKAKEGGRNRAELVHT